MLRPKFHFTPQKGWMNDPNGPVFFRGKYHIFYQHDPNSLVWDRMHWGHAVSDDLLSWEYLPIALFPDEMGDIYSGSCIVDQDNVSGLGSGEEPPLLAFYTSHHMKTKREQQCLAYSLDGITFKKYEGNPIIPGKEHTPARDPHVFKNPVLGGFSMCFTVEKAILFYHSDDLLSWEKTGEFHLPDYALSGMIECPCLIRASVENEDASKSVLLMSMDIPESEYRKIPSPAPSHSRLMQYFVGTFDGYVFREENTAQSPLLVDYGPDFYAGTVFSNVKDPILIAWLGDFAGQRKVPTEKEGFCGILCYPRKLSLAKKGDLYLLRQEFFPPYQGNRTGRIIDRSVIEEISDDGLTAKTSFYS